MTRTEAPAVATSPPTEALALEIVERRFALSVAAAQRFFDVQAEAIADACRRLAERFEQGGTLIVFGTGSRASDAQHVSVEFVHPVIVGKRALPALALTSDVALATAAACAVPRDLFAIGLRVLGRSEDIALALTGPEVEPAVAEAISSARERGLLTILCAGGAGSPGSAADFHFDAVERDPFVLQEVHETLYHVLWELVHVFLEHGSSATASPANPASDGGGDYTRALYPFLFGPTGDRAVHLAALGADVCASVRQKCRDICSLRQAVCDASAHRIAEAGRAVAARVRRGGRIFAFGNGGSATDAQDIAADCMAPPAAGWRRIPAVALTNDVGVVTALGNDVGFDHVFARQILAFGREPDIAFGISTSGESANVLRALQEAKRRGMLTIGLSGSGGGALAQPDAVDVCITADSDYVPRIQEAHATIWHALLAVAQDGLRTP